MPKLLWLFVTPFISSLIAFIFPSQNLKKHTQYVALFMSLIPLFILLSGGFSSWIGKELEYEWFPPLSIDFHLKVDALALIFLYLTALIIPISILSIRSEESHFSHHFFGFVLLLQGLLIGFFLARDLLFFTIFWESMLFPLYFIITLWGGSQSQSAALKFLIYMIAGSTLMIAGVLALYFFSHPGAIKTFNLDRLIHLDQSLPFAKWIFASFALAFSVKTPLFPFHGWLAETYYTAPTPGTILLSSLLSKAGIYGFLRIGLEIFPDHMKNWSYPLLILALIGVLYGGMAAWMQNDFKRLIAYSSFSHVNFILAGIFAWSQTSHEGAILQAFNHGVTIAGLFLVAGWLQDRLHSTSMVGFSGLAKYIPQLCWLTFIFVLSSVALPGTNNFIGELMILYGIFMQQPWLATLLGLTVILSVIYMLRWMQYVYFQTPTPFQYDLQDIKYKEFAVALPLIALIFWIGLFPAPLLKQIMKSETKTTTLTFSKENR